MKYFLRFSIAVLALLSFSFSDAFGQVPTSWQDDLGITTFKEAAVVYSDDFSCGIAVNTGTQGDCDLSNLIEIPVVAGETFKFSFMYLTSEYVRLRAAFDWIGSTATYSANYAGSTSTGDWEEFVYEDVVPSGATGLTVRIRAYDLPGFAAPETQYVDQVIFESPTGTGLTVANGGFELWPALLPEPTNYPTAFAANASEQQIQLSWTDAVGGQLPEAYLILANEDNGFDLPLDGEFVPDDFDFSDGTGAANVPYGLETFTFSNLNPETNYIFIIFPYTNYGLDVNYKIDVNPPIATATTGALQPEITVTEPQAGDTWFRGNLYDITWEIANVAGTVSVLIAADASGGNPTWELLANVPANDLEYSWSIPSDYLIGSDYQMRVSSNEGSAIGNSGIFSIIEEPESYDIVINEIMYNPPQELGDDDYWEYLEIYNNDNESVDLSGWAFTDGFDFTFPDQITLAAGEYLVIARVPDSVSMFYGITNVTGPFADGALNNSGEMVTLSDNFGSMVDQVEYSDGGDWPSEPDGDGPSLSLINPDLDNSLPESWEPSPIMFGTPGLPNNPGEPLIQVTFPNGGENIQQSLSYDITWNYIEVSGNVSIELISLSGDSQTLADGIDVSETSWTWDVPASQSLGNDFIVKITSTDNSAIFDESDAVFSIIEFVELAQIVINEIMYNPSDALGLDDYWEYLELYNNDTQAADLSNWSFTEGFDFIFPEGTMIAAGDYLLIGRMPDTLASFYSIPNLIGPFDGGALNNSGETVELSDATGNVVDVVSYLATEPWPVVPDGNGPSLSLINPNLNNSLPESWEASVAVYGTPGLPNSSEDPEIQLIYPNGGEVLYKEMTYTITWNFANLTGDISIELFQLSGSIQVLADAVPLSQTAFDWEIPASQPTGDDFLIIITSLENPDVFDESDAFFSISEAPQVPALVITEIMYNPPESNTDSLEFIEIYNNDTDDINLSGFSFSSGIEYILPSIVLTSGDYLLVAVDSLAMANTFGVQAWQWTSGGLNNGGELIELRDSFDNLVDFVDYSDQLPWPAAADGDGPSLVFCSPDDDNSVAENWFASAEFAAVNAEGDSIFATPGGPCITTKIDENISESKVLIYPNPSNGIFYLDLNNQNNCLVEIFDRTGMKIYEAKTVHSNRLDVSDITSDGLYVVKITNQSTLQVSITKVIIQK